MEGMNQIDQLAADYLAKNEELGWGEGMSTDRYSVLYPHDLEMAMRERYFRGELHRAKAKLTCAGKTYGMAYYPKTEKVEQSMRDTVNRALGESAKKTIDLLMEMPRFVSSTAFINKRGEPSRKAFDKPAPTEFEIIPQFTSAIFGFPLSVREIIVRPADHTTYGYRGVSVKIDPSYGCRDQVISNDTWSEEGRNIWLMSEDGRRFLSLVAPQIEAAKEKIRQAYDTNATRAKQRRSLEVVDDPDEVIDVGPTSVHNLMLTMAFNRKFRWASGYGGNIAALMKQVRPRDKVVKVKGGNSVAHGDSVAYVLLNPEERMEFDRMLQLRARKKVDRAMGEALLMEMPRYRMRMARNNAPAAEGPRIEYNTTTDTYLKVFQCKATAILSSGDTESFVAREPFGPEAKNIFKLNHSEIEQRYAAQLDIVHDKAIAQAREWVEKNDTPAVYMDDIEAYSLEVPVLPLIKDFRYVVNIGMLHDSSSTLAQFSKERQPGDRMVRIRDERTTPGSGGDLKTYYVLLNPEEYAEFQRRIILVGRSTVDKAIGGE